MVKDVEFFAKLTADQQRLVMESLQPLSFDKGTLIVRQGDIGNELYVIKSGEARSGDGCFLVGRWKRVGTTELSTQLCPSVAACHCHYAHH